MKKIDVTWPEWLSEQDSAIHTAFENEIVKALDECYASADSAGMDWTTEGWVSISARNIMRLLKQLSCPPPPVPEDTGALSVRDVIDRWSCDVYDDPEEDAP